MEEFQILLLVLAVCLQCVEHIGLHNAWQKIIQYNVLIVEADEFLDLFERECRIVFYRPVVEAVKQSL